MMNEDTKSRKNREEWLTEAAREIEPFFGNHRSALKPYRVTCGWPLSGGLGRTRRTVGQCFGAESSAGGTFELFISPTLVKPLDVTGTLAHEMTHVVAGIEAAHGKDFKKIAHYVGLTKGKPREAGPGPLLEQSLLKIVERLGEYPHSALIPRGKIKSRTNGVITLRCLECGCTVRIAKKWVGISGLPVCGCGGALVDELEEGGE
jgi:hypothetical protein